MSSCDRCTTFRIALLLDRFLRNGLINVMVNFAKTLRIRKLGIIKEPLRVRSIYEIGSSSFQRLNTIRLASLITAYVPNIASEKSDKYIEILE